MLMGALIAASGMCSCNIHVPGRNITIIYLSAKVHVLSYPIVLPVGNVLKPGSVVRLWVFHAQLLHQIMYLQLPQSLSGRWQDTRLPLQCSSRNLRTTLTEESWPTIPVTMVLQQSKTTTDNVGLTYRLPWWYPWVQGSILQRNWAGLMPTSSSSLASTGSMPQTPSERGPAISFRFCPMR